ncbi:MAG: hypothetical protein M3O32_02405, partial [Actinomycetota bacterium]|nr:hypothetical protein [Actinomycetota bacterium]
MADMDRLRPVIALTVVGILAVLAAGWFLLVSPKRATAASIRATTETRLADNAALRTQLNTLMQERQDLPQAQAKLAAIAAKIPDTRSLPSLIRALTTVAGSAGVDLVSITPGTTVLVAPTAGGAAATPVAPRAPAARVSSASAGQLGTVPVSLSVAGTYFNLERFLNGIEELTRAMRVTSLAVSPGSGPAKGGTSVAAASGTGSLLALISAQVYTAVGRAGSGTGATAVGAPVVPAAPTRPSATYPSATPA